MLKCTIMSFRHPLKKRSSRRRMTIGALCAVFSELPVSDRKTEPVAGGAVTSFRFNLSDHTSYEIIYCAEAVKKGRLKLPAEQQDYFTSADIGGCWDGCAYEAVDTGESELPSYD